MEKVRCTRCGSIGYTASPDSARCSKCRGEHKVITMPIENHNAIREENINYLRSLNAGNNKPDSFY